LVPKPKMKRTKAQRDQYNEFGRKWARYWISISWTRITVG